MMNKALEIVEARWLFDVPADKIEVLIHPEAVIHSMVEFHDSCLIAQLGTPDMRIPIQYALTYPRRLHSCGEPLDVMALRRLNFETPDVVRFPALQLGFDVAAKSGSAGAVLNAANEAAVGAFRAGQIKFGEITDLVTDALSRHEWMDSPTINRAAARSRFMITPADTTAMRWPTGLFMKERGSSLIANSPLLSTSKSSWPSILTYPPSGRRFSEYRVSPLLKPNNSGPNPMANFSTRIPAHLATEK